MDDIERLTELVLSKIEDYLKIDMSRFKLTNKISKLINNLEKKANTAFLSEDKYLNEQLVQNQDLKLELYKDYLQKEDVVLDVICTKLHNIARWMQ